MASGLELALLDGLLNVFSGSLELTILISIGILILAFVYFKVPLLIQAPVILTIFTIMGIAYAPLRIVSGLIGGVLVAYLIYKLWSGN